MAVTAASAQPAVAGELSLFGLDPATYRPHAVHDPSRTYSQTNCYVDLLVELLHARGDEPLASLQCTLSLAFEGDQFTFYKPDPQVLRTLHGLDVHEMQLYRPLVDHATEQLAHGRTLLVEVDSWFLPDTAATSYRREHVKTSIALQSLDAGAERATYFHNSGLHALAGEDFRGALRVGVEPKGPLLLPYAELARFAAPALPAGALREASARFARAALELRDPGNPFEHFAGRLPGDLPGLAAGPAVATADYAFATVRMAGSAAELAASYAQWLLGDDGAGVAEPLRTVAETCATLSFRLARRRPFDPGPLLEQAARCWDEGLRRLDERLPG